MIFIQPSVEAVKFWSWESSPQRQQ